MSLLGKQHDEQHNVAFASGSFKRLKSPDFQENTNRIRIEYPLISVTLAKEWGTQ